MLKGKKLASMLAVTAMLTSFGLTGIVEGASRAELAAIHVNQSENFQYWNENSPAKKKLVAYVQKVTNPKNPDFIPAEHRLAVFDMDGTLLGERTPSYTDGVFYADRVLHDPNCKVSDEDKKFAQAYWDAISQRKPVPGNRKELVPQLICRTGRDDAAVPGRLRPGIYEKARYRPDEPDLWRILLPAYGRSDFLFRS